MIENQPGIKRITLYDLILMILAFISIIIVTLLIFLPRDGEFYRLFRVLDSLIALVFLGDFFYRLGHAENRRTYLITQLGWLDLLGGIPVNGVGIFRLARLVRGFRTLRHTQAREFIASLRAHLAQNTLVFAVFTALLAVFGAGVMVLVFEARAPGSNIHNAMDAIWWAFVTIATVGYGDYYPVTVPGRLTGLLLMLIGIGIFGVMSAFLADAFISPHRTSSASRDIELAELKNELVELRRLLTQVQADLAAARKNQDEEV